MLTPGLKRMAAVSFVAGGLVAGTGAVVLALGVGVFLLLSPRPVVPLAPAATVPPLATVGPIVTLVPTQRQPLTTATNLPTPIRTAPAGTGATTPTLARTPTAASTPSAMSTRTTPTMTPDPKWTPPPLTLAKGVPTVQPSADNIFSGVVIYNYLDGFSYEMMGRSESCPHYTSGKGVIYRYRDGVPKWEEERYFLTWVSNPNSQYKIRADDPGLKARQWVTYPGCP